MPLAEAAGEGGLVAEDAIEFGDLDKKYQQSTFGAHFVEVGVDAATGEIRVRRMLAVCAAGRILNPKSARSQVIGAMTMGVGAALMEELAVDKRLGFFVNHDLAGYEVPVHADIPHQEVIFLDETDPMSSPMKAKGVGELGICGVGAAVANAIYNATGVRVRDYPITAIARGSDKAEPLVIQDQGSFAVGGKVIKNAGTFDPTNQSAEGQTFHGDHAYVSYQIPVNTRQFPSSSGTAQGSSRRHGNHARWAGRLSEHFLRRRFGVYVIDQPRRGRAGRSTQP